MSGNIKEVDLRPKRNREEKLTTCIDKWSDIKETYELIRDLDYEDSKMSVSSRYIFDPPEIDQFLAFAVKYEKDDVIKLTQQITAGFFECHLEETETHAKKLAERIGEDPRLGDFLDKDFVKLLFTFLGNKQSARLQLHAATIIHDVIACCSLTNMDVVNAVQKKKNMDVVNQYITPSITLDLVSTKDPDLQLTAMRLLRNIALGIPDNLEILEKALDPVIFFLNDASSSPEMTRFTTLTLAAFCQVYPKLPHEKFESVLLALRKLIQYDIEQDFAEEILPYACLSLAYLCDGRKEMVVEDAFFGEVIDRLIVIIDCDSFLIADGGLVAVGSIVRWASDNHIQVMIEKDVLWSLECVIRENHMYSVIYGCWILSNITARKQEFLKDVIRCECIETLVSVVQKFKYIEGRKEAAWAILNAISGASDEHIEYLRRICVKALWNFPTVFSDYLDIVYTCLKVLVKLEAVKVHSNGKLIDNIQFRNYLIMLQKRQFQLVDDVDGLPKSKKLRTTDNSGKYDNDMEYIIMFNFEEGSDLQQPGTPSISIHDKTLGHVHVDTTNIAANQMEVE